MFSQACIKNSVHGGGGGTSDRSCMVGGDMRGWGLHSGRHAWQGVCMAGGMCGGGTCVAGGYIVGGMHGGVRGRRRPLQRTVRILL